MIKREGIFNKKKTRKKGRKKGRKEALGFNDNERKVVYHCDKDYYKNSRILFK